jgi:hypothetical protein
MPSAVPPPKLDLSTAESRLALLGEVDFEGDWDALERATAWVVDGPAKAALIRTRLAPAAAQRSLTVAEEISVVDLVAARHWFDTQPCDKAAQPQGVDGGEAQETGG